MIRADETWPRRYGGADDLHNQQKEGSHGRQIEIKGIENEEVAEANGQPQEQ
jgi:hypothetical protein